MIAYSCVFMASFRKRCHGGGGGGGKSVGENFMGGAYVVRFARGRGHVPPTWRLRQS